MVWDPRPFVIVKMGDTIRRYIPRTTYLDKTIAEKMLLHELKQPIYKIKHKRLSSRLKISPGVGVTKGSSNNFPYYSERRTILISNLLKSIVFYHHPTTKTTTCVVRLLIRRKNFWSQDGDFYIH